MVGTHRQNLIADAWNAVHQDLVHYKMRPPCLVEILLSWMGISHTVLCFFRDRQWSLDWLISLYSCKYFPWSIVLNFAKDSGPDSRESSAIAFNRFEASHVPDLTGASSLTEFWNQSDTAEFSYKQWNKIKSPLIPASMWNKPLFPYDANHFKIYENNRTRSPGYILQCKSVAEKRAILLTLFLMPSWLVKLQPSQPCETWKTRRKPRKEFVRSWASLIHGPELGI